MAYVADAGANRMKRLGLEYTRNFWVLQIGGWTLFGAVMLIWGLNYWTRQDAIINKLLLVVTGLALSLGLSAFYRRLFRAGTRAVWLGAAFLAASFLGAALWFELEMVLFQLYLGGKNGVFVFRPVSIPMGMWLFYGFVLLAWSLCYFAIHTREQAMAYEARASRAEALAQQARLRALRAQLEPHFLFNTLNCISTLIIDNRPETASLMLTRLSEFLRMTLESGDVTEVTLAEELQFVERYIQIQQLRFGDRLKVKLEVEPQVMSAKLPALILQPLIENAVKHGLLSGESGGTILLKAAASDGMLYLSVEDSGSSGNGHAQRGIGLANISSRLLELYGQRAHLQLSKAEGGGMLAAIEMPLRSSDSTQ